MTQQDAFACRRALRDIREIAAVAVLDGAPMTDQEALQTIAAIAGWAAVETGPDQPDCGDVIRRLEAMVGDTDIEAMDDRAALDLFRDVTALLQGGEPAAAGLAS